ncbi:uncharacterized protein LOC127728243 [Mytilus californianus]|uniref:uncharacterized protein LOC127728243 n=1 Tax=Mytilus californianus TaxID=6549 RepID=UPI002246E6B2|nr:uncharacterized protein LOC127728243 [Mytilus californianus]
MMEDRDSCPVCFENFIMPKLLPCKHTFCLRCLKDYCDQQKTVSNEKLTTTDKDSIMDKNQIICPLCRNICSIPKMGFQDLFTNYFVQISRPPNICEICVQKTISTYCTTCFKNKCKICFRQYDHRKKTSTKCEVTEDNRPDPRLPFHFMFNDGIRTEYICEPTKTFQLDVPPNDKGKRWVYSVITSRKGGAYVLPQTVPFVLKFGSNTDLLGKIRTPDPCTCIIELQNGDLLGIFRRSRLILRYTCGGWSHFATTLDYFPYGLAELSDGKIIICGPNANTPGDIKEDEIYGIVRMYSAGGDVLGNIEKKDTESSFLSPHLAVSNKRSKTFAISDQKRLFVTIYHENGDELTTYNGGTAMFNSPINLFGFQTHGIFQPIEMCCSPSGNFIISCTDGTLHVLDPYGNIKGVALANCSDGFGTLTDVAVDIDGNIWCSNSEFGTIKLFRLVRYKNHLKTDWILP